ncbi:MAG: molecular chaperone DnaJ [Chloroflexi bacterium]|nr:molecular chaperone DnaJ [Chloroflexota bacterium]MYC02008.1 molecular chaperone DnaJ [Chloroflexota bacterium]
MAQSDDFYEILGLSREASQDEIRRSFRKLAMEHHPDRVTDPAQKEASEAKFKRIAAAYEVLSDAEKKAKYDQYGSVGAFAQGTGFEGFDFGGFGDIFDAFFGGRRAAGPIRGGDLRIQIELDFEEAVFGCEEEIRASRLEHCTVCGGSGGEPGTQRVVCQPCGGSGELRRTQSNVFGRFVNVAPCEPCDGEGTVIEHPCKACGGIGREQRNRRLKVKIPAGVTDGAQMRLSGEGDAGLRGGPAGNLYVDINVRAHETFIRDGNDLILPLHVNVAQAVLGSEVQIPGIDGHAQPLNVPAGTQHGHEFRLRGQGVPHLRGRGRGDLRVHVVVEIPTKLSSQQRELFEQLAEELNVPTSSGGEEDGVFSRIRGAFSN